MSKSTVRDIESLRLELLVRRLNKTAVSADRCDIDIPMGVADRSGVLPLSWAQQRLWFLDQLDHAAGAAYHLRAGLHLQGRLDRGALRATLDAILGRHEALRTSFVVRDEQPVQQIAPADVGFRLIEHDLSALSGAAQQARVGELSRSEAAEPFDLSTGPLIRGQLLRLSPEDHLLLLTQHHIISDGWSIGVLVREISALYGALSQGQPNPLPALGIQYADYAAWQRQWLQAEVLQGQANFWKSHLGGAPALLELPSDRARPAVQSYAGGSVGFEPASRRDPVHDAVCGLVGVAEPAQWAERSGDRHAGGEPPAQRARVADRLLRQYAGPARAPGG